MSGLPQVPGYDVERLLGEGAFGRVFLAREREGLRRPVALKLFAREQRAAQVVTLEPHAALLAVGRAVLREAAQVLHEEVVARVDGVGVVHAACATGANDRRCSGQMPCSRSAARCSAVP